MVAFVAEQLGVHASDHGLYDWSAITIEYHRAQIREHLGYRIAFVIDQQRLTGWLAEAVAHAERRPERVREILLAESRREQIEPPTAGRLMRIVRSALRTAEQNWSLTIAERLDPATTARLLNLVAIGSDVRVLQRLLALTAAIWH